MPLRRPAPNITANAMLRRHGDFAVNQVVRMIRAEEAEGRPDAAWWYEVLEALWSITPDRPGEDVVH